MTRRRSSPARRTVDVLVALTGLTITSPLQAAIALLVVLTGGLPVLFRSRRMGLLGSEFDLLKFRTMRLTTSGPPITLAGDVRVTSVGRILRRTKCDELPQLFNLLMGDITLIGPRPESPIFRHELQETWPALLEVKPGLTGLATLHFRNEEQISSGSLDPIEFYRLEILPVKCAIEVAYSEARTFRTDALIFLRTFLSLIKNAG